MSLDPVRAALPATRVLLTEDRGQVTREGAVAWPGGAGLLAVPDLSPLIVDASVSVRATQQGVEVPVGRVAVARRWVPLQRPGDRTAEALAREAREAEDQLAVVQGGKKRLEQEVAGVQRELSLLRATLVRNASRGAADPQRWSEAIALSRGRRLALVARARDLRAQEVEARRALSDLNTMLNTLQRSPVRLVTALEIAVEAPPGEIALELRYTLPSAVWRPTYEARLTTGPQPTVDWQIQAMVWQRTGEDWSQVQVTLSTARPSAGAALPPLWEDRLSMRPRTPEERRTVAADFRDQVVESTSVANGEAPDALPGVDDGGETRTLVSAQPVDLPSDGRPHRVQVASYAAPARVRWVCMPERVEAVFREVTLEHRGRDPLLAGPVVLVVDGTTQGTGEVPFVAAGEAFSISFGSNDDVVVRYKRSRKLEKRALGADLTWFVAECVLYHTGGAPVDVEVVQRMPVSELEKVKILPSVEHTRAGAEGPDSSGHVRWKVRLKPGTRERVGLGFRLDLASGVQLPDPW